jgi:DEAD/DEAH box helicase domain-containing protein
VLATAAVIITVGADSAVATAPAAAAEGEPSRDTDAAGLSRPRFDAGLHALEHLIAGVLPVIVANDRYDVGTHSWVGADGNAAIAVFDRRRGSGFAAAAYARADVWLSAARQRIEECSCGNGCPACILLAGCGSSRPLDKSTASRLLAGLLADT